MTNLIKFYLVHDCTILKTFEVCKFLSSNLARSKVHSLNGCNNLANTFDQVCGHFKNFLDALQNGSGVVRVGG